MIKIRAIQIHQYEAADLLTVMETAIPSLQNNEVLVAVHYSGVNPIDIKIRSGAMQQGLPKQFPFIPGWELAALLSRLAHQLLNLKKAMRFTVCPIFSKVAPMHNLLPSTKMK